MEFPVPQFIEMETKIIGPLTWRQFIFLGGTIILCFFLYFFLRKFSLYLFIIIAVFLVGSGAALAFIKINGRPIPTILVHFVTYNLSSKIYLWRKKPIIAALVYKKEKIVIKKEGPEKKTPLMVAGKSRLKDLSNQVELKTK